MPHVPLLLQENRRKNAVLLPIHFHSFSFCHVSKAYTHIRYTSIRFILRRFLSFFAILQISVFFFNIANMNFNNVNIVALSFDSQKSSNFFSYFSYIFICEYIFASQLNSFNSHLLIGPKRFLLAFCLVEKDGVCFAI